MHSNTGMHSMQCCCAVQQIFSVRQCKNVLEHYAQPNSSEAVHAQQCDHHHKPTLPPDVITTKYNKKEEEKKKHEIGNVEKKLPPNLKNLQGRSFLT